ncbi:ATP-binding protein [Bradyrhizobium prioriisuperbiae]|uniref:ATP-binding protein n=1 Tax=Bradyrhizobium prioriisuperbiae TaxID=2854389 RepID=UPI0028EAE90D|nr:adenylate/guanylate cyclase domain-containing protein [Bradyrhizobium prioritasuperba]
MGPAVSFCGGCGRPKTLPSAFGHHAQTFLQSSVPPALAKHIQRSGNAILGERKHVTVVFADILESTQLIDQLDPEEALGVLAPLLRLLMDAVHQHEGFVNQTLGDGIMALFGAPIASEDHAVQACRAALAMRAAVDNHNRTTGANVAIRIGINSGQVVIHSIGSNLAMNYDAVGKTVHLAARMEEIAPRNTIVLSADTHGLAEGFIKAVKRGPTRVKGISEAIDTYELTELRLRTRWQVRSARGLSLLVGRNEELRSLTDAMTRAASGKGQALLISGEAGQGKSRLVHDFIRHLSSDWIVLETACAPQRVTSSYYPVTTVIRTMFNIGPDDTPERIIARAPVVLNRFGPDAMAFLPAVLSLLDIDSDDPDWKKLDPTQRRAGIIDAVRGLVLRQERLTPVVMLVEDVHWMDVESRLVLHAMVAALRRARILLIATQRPDAKPIDRGLSRVDLGPLEMEASHQLLDWLMGKDASLNAIKRTILAQAQGNPLFLEELVQALKDKKVLDGQPGNYRFASPTTRIDIPPTIASVLAARIDLLDGLPKTLLQTSAVIGSDVSITLLSGMVGVEPKALAGELDTLEHGDFLRRNKVTAAAEYSFKHELTREVAYNTMLLGLRRSLHAKAVEIIETRFSDRLDEHIDRLADHAFLAELWQKAVPYQLRSCRRALKRGAYHGAVTIFERALETLSRWLPSPDKTRAELDFRLTAVIALEPLGQHRRIADVLREAQRLAYASNDALRITAVNIQLAIALWRLGEHEAAMTAATDASAIAEHIKVPTLSFGATFVIGIVHHEIGNFAKALEIHEQCLQSWTPEIDQKRAGWAAYPSVMVRAFIAASLIELGELERASAMAEDARLRAEVTKDAYSRATINHVLGRLLTVLGRPTEALVLLQQTWDECLEREMVQMYPTLAARMAEAHLAAGDIDAAIEITAAPEKLDVPLAEHSWGWRYLFVAQGRALLAAGRIADALAAAELALALAQERGEPPQQANALILLGDIAAITEPTAADEHYRPAYELAERCGMKLVMQRCREAQAKLPAQHARVG